MIVIVEAHYDMQCGDCEDAVNEALTAMFVIQNQPLLRVNRPTNVLQNAFYYRAYYMVHSSFERLWVC